MHGSAFLGGIQYIGIDFQLHEKGSQHKNIIIIPGKMFRTEEKEEESMFMINKYD